MLARLCKTCRFGILADNACESIAFEKSRVLLGEGNEGSKKVGAKISLVADHMKSDCVLSVVPRPPSTRC